MWLDILDMTETNAIWKTAHHLAQQIPFRKRILQYGCSRSLQMDMETLTLTPTYKLILYIIYIYIYVCVYLYCKL